MFLNIAFLSQPAVWPILRFLAIKKAEVNVRSMAQSFPFTFVSIFKHHGLYVKEKIV